MQNNITDLEQFIEYKLLKSNFTDEVINAVYALGELTITVKKERIYEICKFLRDNADLSFDFLVDLCGVDYLPEKPRFKVVYHLYSMKRNARLRLKAPVDMDNLEIQSVESLWKAGNWLERETFDMFGIKFKDHPFLVRLFMPDDFPDYPLRKDYPLEGK